MRIFPIFTPKREAEKLVKPYYWYVTPLWTTIAHKRYDRSTSRIVGFDRFFSRKVESAVLMATAIRVHHLAIIK